MKFLGKLQPLAYDLLRIVAAFMFACHGAQKLFGVLGSTMNPPLFSLIWVAGLIELVLGAAILVGFQTRFAAFICSGEMAVAYFLAHWHGSFDESFFPVVNHGEPAVLYCFIFLLIATQGAGSFGVDKKG
jgi:putative oxidoreductase